MAAGFIQCTNLARVAGSGVGLGGCCGNASVKSGERA